MTESMNVARNALAGLAAVALLGSASVARSQTAISTTPAAPVEGAWQFDAAGFIWLPSVGGSVSIFGRSVDDTTSIWDILRKSKFPITLMGHAEARYDQFGFFVEPIYMELRFTPSRSSVSADITTKMFFLEFGAFYRPLQGEIAPGQRWSFDVLAGGRYTSFSNSTALTGKGSLQGLSLSSSQNVGWVDPIIGARLQMDLSPSWTSMIRADIGGFGAGSNFSWQTYGLVGYRFDMWAKQAIAFGGYRALYQDYEANGPAQFKWKNMLRGPVLGLSLAF